MDRGPVPTDQIAGGAEPRPRRRLLVLAIVAVVGVAALGGWAVDHTHERSLDQTAAHRVALAVVDDDATEADVLTELDLVNVGADAVQVLEASFDLPGVPSVSVDKRLAPGERTTVDLADDRPCTTALITSPPRAVRLRLTTPRGQTITWRAPVPAARAALMTAYARFRCAQKHPRDALLVDLVAVKAEGDSLTLTLALTDTSTLPLTMASLTGPPGLLLDALRQPVALAAETTPGVVSLPTMLSVRVRVSDCSVPPSHAVELLAQVSNPYETGTARAELPSGGSTDLLRQLRALC